jgi:hypothetical protein
MQYLPQKKLQHPSKKQHRPSQEAALAIQSTRHHPAWGITLFRLRSKSTHLKSQILSIGELERAPEILHHLSVEHQELGPWLIITALKIMSFKEKTKYRFWQTKKNREIKQS